MHQHAAIFLRHGVADLAFQIELFLAANGPFTTEPLRGLRNRCCRVAPVQMHGRHDILACGMRGLGRQQGGQGFKLDRAARQRGSPARQIAVGGDDGKDRLAEVAQLLIGQDRIVVQQRAAIVLAGNVGGGQHRDDARLALQQFEVDARQPAMRDRRQPQRRVQGAMHLGNVVHIDRFAADMQGRRFMRVAGADHLVQLGAHIPAPGATASKVTACQTLRSAAASGCSARVSSHSRCSRFCATRIR